MPTPIESIAAQYLGPQPNNNEAAAAQAAAAAAQQQQTAEANAAAARDAAAEAGQDAAAAAAPSNEGEENPVAFEIELGGQKRQLNPNQIASTFERYAALNAKHASMKPVLSLVERMMTDTGANAEQVAGAMMAAMKAASKDPKMGAAAAKENDNNDGGDGDDPLAAWERDNAAQLPPGYREMVKGNTSVMGELKKTQQMLAAVLQGSKAVAGAAVQAQQQQRGNAIAQAKQQMAINLSKAQQHHGLPDESANDFLTFAAERGFTLEDFINPDLAFTVVGDFKNAMQSPEMERLKAIAKKRQAFTPSTGSAPAAGSAPAGNKGPTAFDMLTDRVMSNRFPK
jgi:hypothetical protein